MHFIHVTFPDFYNDPKGRYYDSSFIAENADRSLPEIYKAHYNRVETLEVFPSKSKQGSSVHGHPSYSALHYRIPTLHLQIVNRVFTQSELSDYLIMDKPCFSESCQAGQIVTIIWEYDAGELPSILPPGGW